MFPNFPVAGTLALPDAIPSKSSAAKSLSSQRAPLARPRPGSTALPDYRSHTRKACTTLATSATASARLCVVQPVGAYIAMKFLIASRQACLSKARSATAARISGH
eukprot:357485-Chlamydomonas_euryale.AAC.9